MWRKVADQVAAHDGKTVRPGETLLTMEPWVSAVEWDKREHVCASCWKCSDRALIPCRERRSCFYCSKACKSAHWTEEHQHECAVLKAVTEYMDSPVCEVRTKRRKELILCLEALNREKMKYGERLPERGQPNPLLDCIICDDVDRRFDKPSAAPLLYACERLKLIVNRRLRYRLEEQTSRSDHKRSALNPRGNLLKTVIYGMEGIYPPIRSLGEYIGSGVFMEAVHFTSACRPNATWVFDGKMCTLKAVVEILNFRCLDQITITHSSVHHCLLRVGRMGILKSFHSSHGGRQKRIKACTCKFCGDRYEAEVTPLKCVTPSCMEPVPTDDRAKEPCLQCGAGNVERLKLAREEIAKFTGHLANLQKFAHEKTPLNHFNFHQAHYDQFVDHATGERRKLGTYHFLEGNFEEAWETFRAYYERIGRLYPPLDITWFDFLVKYCESGIQHRRRERAPAAMKFGAARIAAVKKADEEEARLEEILLQAARTMKTAHGHVVIGRTG